MQEPPGWMLLAWPCLLEFNDYGLAFWETWGSPLAKQSPSLSFQAYS